MYQLPFAACYTAFGTEAIVPEAATLQRAFGMTEDGSPDPSRRVWRPVLPKRTRSGETRPWRGQSCPHGNGRPREGSIDETPADYPGIPLPGTAAGSGW